MGRFLDQGSQLGRSVDKLFERHHVAVHTLTQSRPTRASIRTTHGLVWPVGSPSQESRLTARGPSSGFSQAMAIGFPIGTLWPRHVRAELCVPPAGVACVQGGQFHELRTQFGMKLPRGRYVVSVDAEARSRATEMRVRHGSAPCRRSEPAPGFTLVSETRRRDEQPKLARHSSLTPRMAVHRSPTPPFHVVHGDGHVNSMT
jgi:hypothetical protein